MWKIKKTLMEDLFYSSKKTLPNEFLCFLAGNKESRIVKEIVMLPSTTGINFASLNPTVIPIDEDIIGSVHSHPGGSAKASNADIKFFQRFSINIIINHNGFRVYNSKGKEIEIETI
jgi:proteasome lid subunit RPN8/RPN11